MLAVRDWLDEMVECWWCGGTVRRDRSRREDGKHFHDESTADCHERYLELESKDNDE